MEEPRGEDPAPGDPTLRTSKLAEVSREIGRIYKVQFGRGPTMARTDFAGPDLVICSLEDSLTPAEKRMAEIGDHQRLRELRLYFQRATKDDFCEVVERHLERRVRAFVSGLDTDRDVAAEIFYLEPRWRLGGDDGLTDQP